MKLIAIDERKKCHASVATSALFYLYLKGYVHSCVMINEI